VVKRPVILAVALVLSIPVVMLLPQYTVLPRFPTGNQAWLSETAPARLEDKMDLQLISGGFKNMLPWR